MSLNLFKYHTNPETIAGYDQAINSVPDLAWDHIFGTSDVVEQEELLDIGEVDLEELRKREHLWVKSARYSYVYALEVLKGERFEKGEDAIATDAAYSYLYAKEILKGERFEKGEDAIATSAQFSHGYAKDVLKGRFEKGEDAIATNERFSYLYAKYVLKGERFKKGEDVIRGSVWQGEYEKLTGVKL